MEIPPTGFEPASPYTGRPLPKRLRMPLPPRRECLRPQHPSEDYRSTIGCCCLRAAVTWAQTVRDIGLALINKGQAPILFVAAIFVVMLIRMPQEKVGELADDILSTAVAWRVFGYGLWIVTMIGWVIHLKYVRKKTYDEQDRMGKEKSDLQGQLAKGTIKSSKG